MAQRREDREEREDRRRRSERRAREIKAVNEAAVEEVVRAAGARRSTPEARRALRALAERELARFASEAVAEAKARNQDEVDEECVAVGAASAEARRPSEYR